MTSPFRVSLARSPLLCSWRRPRPACGRRSARRPKVRRPLRGEKLPAKCCFTNPSYSGTCEVQPAKDESCGQILDYLNNPMSQGKGYCGNTEVRSGWKSVVCEPKKP